MQWVAGEPIPQCKVLVRTAAEGTLLAVQPPSHLLCFCDCSHGILAVEGLERLAPVIEVLCMLLHGGSFHPDVSVDVGVAWYLSGDI
ncbi:hypothetical protein D3C77_623220 [compost metagenome]